MTRLVLRAEHECRIHTFTKTLSGGYKDAAALANQPTDDDGPGPLCGAVN